MSEGIDFNDFPYFSIHYIHPNYHSLGTLLYPAVISRFMSNLEFIADSTNPLPKRFGACRIWNTVAGARGRKSQPTLSHKYRGNLNPQLISFALARPKIISGLLMRRRLPRLSYRTLCGRPGCLNPLHQECDQDPRNVGVHRPRPRTAGCRNNDWLSMPELAWLRYRMRTSFNHDLGDVVTEVSEDIGVHFTVLVNIWNTIVELDRKVFYETFVVEGEQHVPT